MYKYSLFYLFILLSLASCMEDRPEFAIDYQRKLMEAIRSFDFQQKALKNVAVSGFNTTLQGLDEEKNVRISHKNLAFQWKARYDKIQYEFGLLQDDLKKIDTLAQQYFSKLDTLTNKIGSANLKANEIKINQAFKAEWENIIARGKSLIRNFSKLNSEAGDIHKIIVNDGMRQKTENSTLVLKQYLKANIELFSNINDFSCQAALHISVNSQEPKELFPVCSDADTLTLSR